MARERENPRVGEQVIFLALPPGLLDRLPDEDQRAIIAMVGKPVMLVGYDEDGRAELEFDEPFTHDSSHTHSIWVAPEFITPVRHSGRDHPARPQAAKVKLLTRRSA